MDNDDNTDTHQQSVEVTDAVDGVYNVGSDGRKTFSSKELREYIEWMKELKKKEINKKILMDIDKKKFKKKKRNLLMDIDSDESDGGSSDDTEVERKKKDKWEKGLKDIDDLFKEISTSSRGANVLKELMIGKNYSINQSNIYKNGNFDFWINGYPLLLLNGVKKYVKRKMPLHKLRELLVENWEDLIDVFSSDCVIFLDIEVVELIKRLYMDIKYEKDRYNLYIN